MKYIWVNNQPGDYEFGISILNTAKHILNYRNLGLVKKVLFIGLVWPEPTSSAAGWRILQLVRLFQGAYEVHFASAAAKSEFSHDLMALGVTEHQILLNDSSFDQFVRELQPAIVVFDRFMVEEQYGWRVAQSWPEALRVLDTEDLHFLRAARLHAYKTGEPIDLHSETTFREMAAIYRSDLTLLISEAEHDLLTGTFHLDPELLHHIPFVENPIAEAHIAGLPTFAERRDFVFIGNFIHEPNWRTVEILKKEVWPRLKKAIPDAALHVYGAYVPQKAMQLHKPSERFFVLGRADDARQTLSAYKVLLAPIPAGAGTKGKFVDAMYAGTPALSSTVGAEGMAAGNEWNGFITDDVDEFVEKAVLLYHESAAWEAAQSKGFAIFNTQFAQASHTHQLLAKCAARCENLHEHRRKNFIGQMLQHHTTQSSKYMSLWIEAKNKYVD